MGTLADPLRIAIESGDWSECASASRPDAVLHTSNEAGRRQVAGADAIVAHLARPGPGEIRDWDAQEWPTGVALSFEWEGASGTDRRRWYVRTGEDARDRRAVEHRRPPDRPRRGGGGQRRRARCSTGSAPRDVEPLSHGGNSGAALLRARTAPTASSS